MVPVAWNSALDPTDGSYIPFFPHATIRGITAGGGSKNPHSMIHNPMAEDTHQDYLHGV